MVHVIKVYFAGQNQTVQIRRLAVNSEVVSRYDLLVRKIREMFPVLAQGCVEVTWKDSENDIIHMSSDEELAQALASADDDILRIYAHSLDNQQHEDKANHNVKSSNNEIHQNVICDGCDKIIHGYRYKCLQCRNFDLCSSCDAANKHGAHDMIKLARPTNIAREWVFIGARKFWRSMFGRCPASYFTASIDACKQEQAAKRESENNHWTGILDDLLKGGSVSADKLIKENLGGFLNFIDSVSGNLDVKLERDTPKPSPCSEKQENKTDENANNNGSSNVKPNVASCLPTEEYLQTVKSKAAEILGDFAAADAMEKEKSVEPCGLFHNAELDKKSDKLAEEPKKDKDLQNNTKQCSEDVDISIGGATAKIPIENLAKLFGLSGDNITITKSGGSTDSNGPRPTVMVEHVMKPFGENEESTDGWTILNKQDDKKDATSTCDKGAKPKYPNIYPEIFEKAPSSEMSKNNLGNASAEIKLNEVPTAPKPAIVTDQFKQNENAATHQNPEIMNALVKMQAMGFTNEGGWLERLLITKDGNINATLDALYPNTRRN